MCIELDVKSCNSVLTDVIARADNAYKIILIRERVLSLPNFLIERTDFASLLDVLLRPP